MKIFPLIMVFSLAFTKLVLAQGWVKVSLDNKTYISFASAPEITYVGNKKVFQLAMDDYIMNSVITDLSSNPDFIIEPKDLNEFYEGVIDGSLDAATDAHLISKKTIKTRNIEGREIIYTKDFDGVDDLKVTKRIYLVDRKVIILEFWKLSENDLGVISNKFFNSFQLL